MKQLTFILIILLFVNCKNNEKSENKPVYQNNSTLQSEHPGKKLMDTYCKTCHNAEAPEGDGRIAPPMVAIKARYLNLYNSKEDFVNAITNFTTSPSKEDAILFGAVRRFGVMPKQMFPEGSIEKIAEYLYNYKIEEPTWFEDHIKGKGFKNYNQGQKASTLDDKQKSTEEIGLEYAMSTKKVLGQNLMGTIQNKGVMEALEFCNVKAMPLTDSMSAKHHATIKRVSNKNRNPNNKANTEELSYINKYKIDLAQNNNIQPVTVETNGKVHFYYPILTNSMCLQCHCSKKDIQPEVSEKILKLV